MKNNKNLKVAIVMGSQSDYKTMQLSAKILKKIGIKFETSIISAHRTPERMYKFAISAAKNNIGVIIAGAGGLCTFTRYDFSINVNSCFGCANRE